MSHSTYALVKDAVVAEEQDPVQVKGFAKPIRSYKITGLHDDTLDADRIIQQEQAGMKLFLDLGQLDKASATEAVENILARLKGSDRDGG
jgi:hypothetical protein